MRDWILAILEQGAEAKAGHDIWQYGQSMRNFN